MPKNLVRIPDTNLNKLFPKQFLDSVNYARLITFDATSPVSPTLMPNAISENHPNELRNIFPKTTKFAARFVVDTIAEDMKFYILSKIKNCNPDEILLFKINSRNRTSFRIIIPENLFQQIVNPEFWPKNALVCEFIYSERNVRGIISKLVPIYCSSFGFKSP